MLTEIFSASALTALFQVIMIDLVLAGDNAIVIALAAAGLPKEQRPKVIAIGIAAATVLRIVLAIITTQLLGMVGLLLAGGILLLWVSWKMWRELKSTNEAERATDGDHASVGSVAPRKTLKQAVWQIIIADLSMSLDNVLAVGGAARYHPWVLIFGLVLSIALMGIAASWIARVLQKHHWVGYVGLAIIVYVAIEMIWRGWHQVEPFASSFASSNPVIFALAIVAAIAALAMSALRMKRSNMAGD